VPGDDGVRTNAELTEATAAGLRWITYTRIGLELLMLCSMVLLARLIPPAAFGIYAVVVIVQELAITMPMEGVGNALVQRRAVQRSHLQGGLALSLVVGTALAVVTLIAAELIARPLYGDETAHLLMIAAPCFLLGAVGAVPLAVLRRRLDFARTSIVDIFGTLTRTVVTVVLAIGGLDAEALVLGHIASMIVAVAVALAFAMPPLPRWNSAAIRDLLPYGFPATLASVAWTGFRNGDYAIIGARLGAAQAGYYWRAYQLAVEYQRKVSVVMTQMAFPILARAASEDAMLALRRRMVQVLTVVLFPALVLLVVLAPVLVPWTFGPLWEPAVLPMQILALGGGATLVIDAIGPALAATGRAKALLGYGVGHFVVYAGAVLLVSSRGIAAVALAASVVHLIFVVVAYQVLLGGRGGIALRALWIDLWPATGACLALFAVGAPADWALSGAGSPPLIHMTLVAATGGLAYLLALRTAFPIAFGDLVAVLRRVVPSRGRRLLGRFPRLRTP